MDFADPHDVDGLVERCKGFAAHGVTHVHGEFHGYFAPGGVRRFGEAVVRRLAELDA